MGVLDQMNKILRNLFHRQRDRTMCEENRSGGPISFHPSRGKEIRRSADGTTVHKKRRSLWKRSTNALSFSNRTVTMDEVVTIHITNMAVIVGFMFESPESLPQIESSFDVFHRGNGFGIVLPKQPSLSIEFWYNRHGDVHFKIDREEVAIFFGVIDPQVAPWILIDMYNSTTGISAMDGDVIPIDFGTRSAKPRSCDLCFSEIANATLGKCGHASCCFACAKKWLGSPRKERTCPYCRMKVTSIVKNWWVAPERNVRR